MKVVIKMHVKEVFTALYINFDFILSSYITLNYIFIMWK